jgi:DNA-binding beta-propeller fold protein YncE
MGPDEATSQSRDEQEMGMVRYMSGVGFFLLLAVGAPGCAVDSPEPEGDVPTFRADPDWPRPFAENWVLGAVTGIAVDSRDHVWVTHSPSGGGGAAFGAAQDPPISTCCVPAPDVIEFDPDGNVVQAWVMDGDDYDWPSIPHGIFVDHTDHVWIGSRPNHQLLKFSRDGDLVLTIGELGVSGGSNDPDRLGTPADMWVSPETNEVFVADGYGNRRIIVFDGETGAYLRHWGAYGEVPDDDYEYGPRGADEPPARQFGTAHGIVGSRDGLLYLADRRNNRVQVFQQDGTFVAEKLVAPETLSSGSAHDVALSADADQRFLYLMDGVNHRIWVLQRDDLEMVGHFGQGGYQLGQFIRPHNMDSDSRGNIYSSEAETQRVQRFLVQGAGAP